MTQGEPSKWPLLLLHPSLYPRSLPCNFEAHSLPAGGQCISYLLTGDEAPDLLWPENDAEKDQCAISEPTLKRIVCFLLFILTTRKARVLKHTRGEQT